MCTVLTDAGRSDVGPADAGPDAIGTMAAAHPEAAAWQNLADGSALSFRAWDTGANRLARGLMADGVGRQDRVVIAVGPDEPFPWLIAYAAIHRAGAVAVPVDTRLAPPELGAIVSHADPVAILAGSRPEGGVGRWSDLDPAPERPRVVATTDQDGGPPGWSVVAHDDGSALDPPSDAGRPGDLMDIMYTSGTTGAPKAVLVPYPRPTGRRPGWSGLGFMTSSPFSTTSGVLLVYGPMSGGLSGWFLPRFDPGRWLALVEERRPVAAFIVPAMAQLLVAHPRFTDADLSGLAALTLGGAPVARATLERLGQRLPGAEVLVGYGLTEFGAVTRTPPGDRGRHLGSAGRPLPGVTVRIVDGAGAELPPGRSGEITVRGDGPPRRYDRDVAATAATWREGWLCSGDLGHLDEDGFLWITGRTKDLIIRGGHNISPGEVEEALFAHPAVVDAAVAGLPHDVLGEDVGAWVVLQEGSDTTPADLRAFLLERLADYKVPRSIRVVASLPRNAAGKVVKRELDTTGRSPERPEPGGSR